MAQSPVSAHRNWQLWIPTGAVLVLGLLGIGVQGYFHLASQETRQLETARQAVALASEAINQALLEQRHLLQLFTRQHGATLDAAISAPGSTKTTETLAGEISAYFPSAFAHTLADRDGKVLLEDFDGLVGDACRANIRAFARTSNQHLQLHPNPIKPHYDVMARHGEYVFFVSFEPRAISGILAEHESPGLRLYVLKQNAPLVEISAAGNAIRRDQARQLSRQERGEILAAGPVPDTDWQVVALPVPDHQLAEQLAIGRETAVLLAALGLFGFAFHMLLAREHRQRLNAETEARDMARLGFVDALTGLPNRRALDADLEREWLNLERSDEPLSLLMIDLDHFKNFNDTHGHLAGDHCLRVVAQTMRSALKRPRDRIARFGGEEFAILLPNTPCLAAKLLADTLHEAVRDAFAADNAGPGVTISIGISCAHAKQLKSARELLDVADQALYGAKGAGRDTTVTILAHA